ncbi:hypothetical protein [Streptomyces crystallinus]|uniref:Uncharacterized protein n=1 Tax=Streptomyces crystallinus TaxID=68191 RepID=A0ABP3S7F7_9ACTN
MAVFDRVSRVRVRAVRITEGSSAALLSEVVTLEDSLSISSEYYGRLVSAAQELGTLKSVDKLDELVTD